MKPNIFDIATKELNQDAFITWLLRWADKSCESIDNSLYQCAQDFVRKLIQKQNPNFNEPIETVNSGRQWENIDVWAEINGKYLIIIEDKTHSYQHSNQLERYRGIAEKWCAEKNYQPPICIYLKTGNEAVNSLKNIEKQGFSVFNRKDFIAIFTNSNVTNDIFLDFKDRLTRIEKHNYEFENKIIKDWNGNDWQGFFQFLEKEMGIVNWSYVNNPNGGFWHAVLNWDYWGIYPAYIQIEEGKLCFKISTDPEEPVELPENVTRGQVRDELHRLIISKSKECKIPNIRKPDRFGNGKYMTVAIVDSENWLGLETNTINTTEVVATLKMYRDFVDNEIITKQ